MTTKDTLTAKDTRIKMVKTYVSLLEEMIKQCPGCKEIEEEALFWQSAHELSKAQAKPLEQKAA